MAEENGGRLTKKWHSKPYPFILATRPENSATGKNIVITGGGTGIGKSIAIAFARAHAKTVTIVGRRIDRLQSAAAEISAAGPSTGVYIEPVDLHDRTMVDQAFQHITEKVGAIDILVQNAAATPKFGPVVGYDEAEFRHNLEFTVVTTFNVLQAFLPHAVPNTKIIHISSGVTHMQPVKNNFMYAVVKTATLKMFDYLAAERPDLHIVNVQPGVYLTELTSQLLDKDIDDRT